MGFALKRITSRCQVSCILLLQSVAVIAVTKPYKTAGSGQIDDLKVWSKALTPDELELVYSGSDDETDPTLSLFFDFSDPPPHPPPLPRGLSPSANTRTHIHTQSTPAAPALHPCTRAEM